MNSASLPHKEHQHTPYNNFGVAVGAYTTAIIASTKIPAPIVYKVDWGIGQWMRKYSHSIAFHRHCQALRWVLSRER